MKNALKTIKSDNIDYLEEIQILKKQLNAVILGHYYQDDDIQDIADFIGDSLELSRKAAGTNADVIVFCGVKFMAEVAKILNPDKLVLIPDMNAGCSLEDACPADKFSAFREAHPDHIAITYINCSAEVKALSDIIVTSSNAEKIINQIPKDQKIIFAPDKHLGRYLSQKTGREMLLWDGSCMVHENFSQRDLLKLTTSHPKALVIAHPECPENLLKYAHFIGSTSALLNYTKDKPGQEFIILTEPGVVHQMQKNSPGSKFYVVGGVSGGCVSCNSCPYMRLNTQEKLYLTMKNKLNPITVPPAIAARAKQALDRMLEMS